MADELEAAFLPVSGVKVLAVVAVGLVVVAEGFIAETTQNFVHFADTFLALAFDAVIVFDEGEFATR